MSDPHERLFRIMVSRSGTPVRAAKYLSPVNSHEEFADNESERDAHVALSSVGSSWLRAGGRRLAKQWRVIRFTSEWWCNDCCGRRSCSPPLNEAMTMKTKTWTVVANTGKQADLESDLEKTAVQKPTHITAREFVHWLAPESHIDDSSLRSLFKL